LLQASLFYFQVSRQLASRAQILYHGKDSNKRGDILKFFIPHMDSDEQAAKIYSGIKELATQTLGWPIAASRIRRIEYVREGKPYFSEVGQPDSRVNEEVIAILESIAYLVCTPNMGVVRGMPLMVEKKEIQSVEYFDAE
jgi:hypothetical protein